MSGATVNKSSHPARFWLSPASLAQLLAGLVAGIWLSRQGEWGADWQSRSSAGLGAQESGAHGWAAFMTLSDNLLLAALLLCWRNLKPELGFLARASRVQESCEL